MTTKDTADVANKVRADLVKEKYSWEIMMELAKNSKTNNDTTDFSNLLNKYLNNLKKEQL